MLSQLSRFFRWMLEKQAFSCIGDVTPRCWFTYTEARISSGIKPTSLNTTLRILQSFLKLVSASGAPICERMLEVRPLKTCELLPRDITEIQLNQLLEQANLHDYAWILLMAHNGLRTCEIRNLRWSDIDLQRRTICIEESKGLRSRVIFLSPPTTDALKKFPKRSQYIFSYNNQPLSNRYCQLRLKTMGKKCGVDVTPHQLRHTAATILLNTGMSYVDTTLRYARASDKAVEKDYQQAMELVRQKNSARSLL
jgi:integrase